MRRSTFLRGLFGCALLAVAAAAQADEAALWRLLQGGGQVVLLRHALSDPGVGDPPGMRLEDCTSQRNLSEQGRREADRLGEALRNRRIPVAGLLSSPWCRCLETARLVFDQPSQVEPALGNLFGRQEREAQQMAELKKLVQRAPAAGNVFMVTHGSTILALTGVSPGSSEMVILTPLGRSGFRVAGRLSVR